MDFEATFTENPTCPEDEDDIALFHNSLEPIGYLFLC